MLENISICLIRGDIELFSNDDVFDQGPNGIVRYGNDDVSFIYACK